jgi:hypothetical protein
MVLLVACLAVAAFLIGFHLAGVVPAARRAIATARSATGVMRDPALDDLAKEKAVRKAGLSLLSSYASITLRSAAALLASFLPILLADATGLVDKEATMAFLLRWDVILGASAVMIAVWLIARRR